MIKIFTRDEAQAYLTDRSLPDDHLFWTLAGTKDGEDVLAIVEAPTEMMEELAQKAEAMLDTVSEGRQDFWAGIPEEDGSITLVRWFGDPDTLMKAHKGVMPFAAKNREAAAKQLERRRERPLSS